MAVVREDVVKVSYDVNDRNLTQVDSGINRLVGSVRRLAGAGGVGSITKGFDSVSKSVKSFANTDFAGKITSGIEEFNAEAAAAREKLQGVKKVATGIAHPIKTAATAFNTLDNKVLAIQMSAGRATAEFKRMAATKVSNLKKNLTEIKTALTQGQTGAKGFATAIKNIGKVSMNAVVNGVRNLATNLKGKAHQAAQKLKQNLTNVAKTSLNSLINQVGKLGSGLKSAASRAGELATNMAKTAAKSVAAGVAATATAVGAVGVSAIKSYAEYEQLVGGIDTLFKDSNKEVMKYANNAYKTAGMSANTYMDTVTSFSASLLQSLGGDTSAAAKMADMAVKDMADNANKMGTSIDSIVGTYQSLARGNYAMLDNLKLGYGGTKEELNRLLADAEKLTGKKFDVSNFGDIVEAIHAVQKEMGITGTTAKEAAKTIQGSAAAMKAAWSNFITGMADENQNADTLIKNLVDSVITFGDNIIPRIQTMLPRLASGVTKLVTSLGPRIIEAFSSLLPVLATETVNLFSGLITAIQSNAGTIVQGALDLVNALVTGFLTIMPQLVVLGAQLIAKFAAGIAQQLPQLVPMAVKAITTIVNGLISCMDSLVTCAMQLIQGLAQGLIANLPQIATAALNLVTGLVDSLLANIQLIIQTGLTLIRSLTEGLLQNLPMIIEAALQLVMGLMQGLISNISVLVEGALQLVTALAQGLLQALPQILQAAMQLVFGLVQGLLQNMTTIVQAGFQLITGLINGLIQMIPQIVQMGILLIVQLVQGIMQNLPAIIQAGIQLIVSLIAGIVQAIPQILGMIPQIFGAFIQGIMSVNWLQVGWDIIKAIIGGLWEGAKSLVKGAWEGIKGLFSDGGSKAGAAADTGIASGLTTNAGTVNMAATGVANGAKTNLSAVGNTFSYGTQANSNLASGITAGSYMPANAASATGTNTSQAMSTAADTGRFGVSAVQNLANSINGNSGTAVSAAASMSSQVESAASSDVTVKVVGDTSSMNALTSQIGSLVSSATSQLQGIPQAFAAAFSKAMSATQAGMSAITATFTKGMAKLVQAATQGMQRTVTVVKAGMNRVRATVASTNLYSSGVSVMQGLNRGMQSQIPALIATAQRAAAAIKSATDGALDIHSPSRVMEESGVNAGLGQVKGLRKTIPDMQIAAREVSNASIPYDSYGSDSSGAYYHGGSSEYTTISPVFNLTVSGTQDDRATARKIKRYVAEAISETLESMERKSYSLREV